MTVRVLAFAQLRDIVGAGAQTLDLPAGATVRDAWHELVRRYSALESLAASTRLARNGAFAADTVALGDGDELALLPPVSGG